MDFPSIDVVTELARELAPGSGVLTNELEILRAKGVSTGGVIRIGSDSARSLTLGSGQSEGEV